MIQLAPEQAARQAGLRYVSREQPGFRRVKNGRGFKYLNAKGKPASTADRKRIKAMVLPPAWRDVWICPLADGHLQATGKDVRGRLQYRYHALWTSARNTSKYDTMPAFGRALPAIRRTVHGHMKLKGMPRQRVIACIVHLLDQTLIRVGNDEYARDNESFGLTTIRNRHVKVRGGDIRFNFSGKSGKRNESSLQDAAAGKIIRHCQELPGQELFGYLGEDGKTVDLGSGDINEYLAEITGEGFTAKDFRTWGGTAAAAEAYASFEPPSAKTSLSEREMKQRCTEAVKAASVVLHNTVATCRKFYVHPKLADAYADGSLHRAFAWAKSHRRPGRMTTAERAVLRLLKPR